MKEFLDFLQQYKELLACGLCIVFSLITFIIKKKPMSLDEFILAVKNVCLALPEIINDVEAPKNGALKKARVEVVALNIIRKSLGRSLTQNERSYFIDEIDKTIELILSTPQKKE